MKVALIGASGKVGRRLLTELRMRDHEVTGISRNVPDYHSDGLMQTVDANDANALAKAIRGHDALMVAGRFVSMNVTAIVHAMALAAVRRVLVVGGAGTLFVADGLQFMDTPDFPDAARPEGAAGREFLNGLQGSNVDWTFLSPALSFGPGERTAQYRLGGDVLMRHPDEASTISYEDLAKALVDELETPRHLRRRFSIPIEGPGRMRIPARPWPFPARSHSLFWSLPNAVL